MKRLATDFVIKPILNPPRSASYVGLCDKYIGGLLVNATSVSGLLGNILAVYGEDNSWGYSNKHSFL